jgi:glycosyltransferase involved in cell wall biosynthesis
VSQRPRLLIVGPGPTQVGGLATFLGILFSSDRLNESYELIHLDTTRGARGAGVASRFTWINIVYFARQTLQLANLTRRYQPRLMHLPLTSYWAFWKDAAFILIARLLGMKVVAHLHGGIFDRYFRQSPRPVQRLIGWVMCRADVVIALSQWWRRFLLDEVCPDIRVEVVPNTVDKLFAGAASEPGFGAARCEELVLFVGGIGHRKGVFDILKAVPLVRKERPNCIFVFAGQEESRGAQAEVDTACAAAQLDGAVRFVGQVTGQAKLEFFRRAALFVLPSHGENLPYVVLEAMGAGLPVVVTPVGAVPEVVQDGRNGFLIAPGDYEALANRIVRLLDDAELRAGMSRANIERIRADYLPDVAMRRLGEIYAQLLAPNQDGDA